MTSVRVPFGAIREGDFTMFVVVSMIAIVCLAVVWVQRIRARRDPDRGGHGYTPVDPRWLPDAAPAPKAAITADPREGWLLALAAPFAQEHGCDIGRWDLGVVGAGAGLAGTRAEWRERRRRAERAFSSARTAGEAAWGLAELAWVIRLGVAAGHLDAASARAATETAVEAARGRFVGWLDFGDAFADATRARGSGVGIRALYAPGRAWGDTAWPSA